MKFTTEKALVKHLDGAAPDHLSPVYCVVGKDPYDVESALREIGKVLPGLEEKTDLQADKLSGELLYNHLNSNSLFSSHRTLVLHGADKLKGETKEVLERYLGHPHSSITLVLTASSFPANTRIYKSMEKVGVIYNPSDKVKPWEKERLLIDWLAELAHRSNKKIAPDVCRYIVQNLGEEKSTLSSDLEKLICYVGEKREITIDDVQALCSAAPRDTIWKLGESIFYREAGKALEIGKQMLEQGVPILTLIRQIRSQFQTDFQVASILEHGGTPDEVTAAFPYMRGRILNQHINMAKEYGKKRFVRGIPLIDATELQAKNSGTDHATLIELLITKLTL